MNTVHDMIFRRKFSVNMYKDKKLMLGKMSFSKDWISTDRGDPYPCTGKGGTVTELIEENTYKITSTDKAFVKRLLGQHMPVTTYDITAASMTEGACLGVSIDAHFPDGVRTISVYMKRMGDEVKILRTAGGAEAEAAEGTFAYADGISLVVTVHNGGQFDMYIRYGDHLKKAGFFEDNAFENLCNESVFKKSTASLYAGFDREGQIVVPKAEMYIDCGVSQADIRPIRYEDGQPIMENGKIFLTLSTRYEFEKLQTVFSWNPSTCDFTMEGVLFFDTGDGNWCGDVASSIIYDRNEKNWKIWMCSFSHDHVLAWAQTENDPRFGVNVIDVNLMPFKEGSCDTDFAAKIGDEDPDMYYDKDSGKWYMAICRSDSEAEDGHYSYFLFESDKPFENYTFLSKSSGDAVTGGSFIKTGGKRFFTCGANFDKRAQYNIYDNRDFTKCSHIKCDFDDGGFRGWGSVIPIPCGTRTKYVWITFDRHNGSQIYNWSYGNVYVYEADVMNHGYEW